MTVYNFRKDTEISSMNSKLESEQSLIAQLQKKIKEQQVTYNFIVISIIIITVFTSVYTLEFFIWMNGKVDRRETV